MTPSSSLFWSVAFSCSFTQAHTRITAHSLSLPKSAVYGIEADPSTPKPLPSYDDQNTLVFTSTPARTGYVVKIHDLALTGQSETMLDAQNDAMAMLFDQGVMCPQPQPKCPTALALPAEANSRFSHRLPGYSGRYVVRVLLFVPGTLMASVKPPKPTALLRSLGAYMGRLDRALQDFSHPGCTPATEGLWVADNSHLAPEKYSEVRVLYLDPCEWRCKQK